MCNNLQNKFALLEGWLTSHMLYFTINFQHVFRCMRGGLEVVQEMKNDT